MTGGDRSTLFPYWQYVRRAGGAGSSDVGAALVAARPGGGKTVRRGPRMGRRISHGGNPSFFARVRNQTAVRAVLKAERREAHGGTLAGTGGPGGAVRRDALPAGLRPHRLPGGRGGRDAGGLCPPAPGQAGVPGRGARQGLAAAGGRALRRRCAPRPVAAEGGAAGRRTARAGAARGGRRGGGGAGPARPVPDGGAPVLL